MTGKRHSNRRFTAGFGPQTGVESLEARVLLSGFGNGRFEALLTTGQEVDPVDSEASGIARLYLYRDATQLRYTLRLKGVDLDGEQTPESDDDVTGIHIHIAGRGENGPIVFGILGTADDPLNPDVSDDNDDLRVDASRGIIRGVWDAEDTPDLPDSLAALNDSRLYVNVHTEGASSGEIRGQIEPKERGDFRRFHYSRYPYGFRSKSVNFGNSSYSRLTSTLDAQQEVDPSNSTATGSANLLLNRDGDRLYYRLKLEGLDLDGNQTPDNPDDDVTGVHIHNAQTGENGPIIFGILGNAENPLAPTETDDVDDLMIDAAKGTIQGVWDSADSPDLAAFVDSIVEGDAYFNVHTEGIPTGTIRGQITESASGHAGFDGGCPPSHGRSRFRFHRSFFQRMREWGTRFSRPWR